MGWVMSRMVKEFVEVPEYTSLDGLIERLSEIRGTIPNADAAEVRLQGCDTFGRKLSVSYLRPQTAEEAACDARYAEAYRQSRERELSRLQDELGVVCRAPRGRGGLRAVA